MSLWDMIELERLEESLRLNLHRLDERWSGSEVFGKIVCAHEICHQILKVKIIAIQIQKYHHIMKAEPVEGQHPAIENLTLQE